MNALALPAELTIFTAGELHPQWLAWLEAACAAATAGEPGAEAAHADASAVDQVDAAGLQLLLSLQRTLADRGLGLQLQAPSATLTAACAALGLGGWLAEHLAEHPGEPAHAERAHAERESA